MALLVAFKVLRLGFLKGCFAHTCVDVYSYKPIRPIYLPLPCCITLAADCAGNQLDGTLPNAFATSPVLTTLILNSNALSALPSTWGLSGSTDSLLHKLNVADNQLQARWILQWPKSMWLAVSIA